MAAAHWTAYAPSASLQRARHHEVGEPAGPPADRRPGVDVEVDDRGRARSGYLAKSGSSGGSASSRRANAPMPGWWPSISTRSGVGRLRAAPPSIVSGAAPGRARARRRSARRRRRRPRPPRSPACAARSRPAPRPGGSPCAFSQPPISAAPRAAALVQRPVEVALAGVGPARLGVAHQDQPSHAPLPAMKVRHVEGRLRLRPPAPPDRAGAPHRAAAVHAVAARARCRGRRGRPATS